MADEAQLHNRVMTVPPPKPLHLSCWVAIIVQSPIHDAVQQEVPLLDLTGFGLEDVRGSVVTGRVVTGCRLQPPKAAQLKSADWASGIVAHNGQK